MTVKCAKKKPAAPDPRIPGKLTRLRLKAGDVVVFHPSKGVHNLEAVCRNLCAWLKAHGLPNVGVLLVQPGESVEMLSEQRMREMGWIRPYEVIK